MYVKVYIENNQLFREDNGCLIGEASVSLLDPIHNNKAFTLLYGYMDTTGFFVKLCRDVNCSFACLSERKPECRYAYKDSTEGLYIEI